MLLAVVVGVLFFDPTGWGAKVLFGLAVGGVAWELGVLLGVSGWITLVLSALWVVLESQLVREPWGLVWSALIGFALLLVGAKWKSESTSVTGAPVFIAGVGVPILRILSLPAAFPALLVAAIPIWAGDTAAIFAGKALGKHKLAPSISPNKTWEGSIANLLAAVAAAAALGYFLKYPMDKMLILGVSCGVIGQLGDLFESYLKRQTGVKDSGNLLPGHGGVFDRLDSLLMTAPFSYWILSSFLK